jgi:hypothetical protein
VSSRWFIAKNLSMDRCGTRSSSQRLLEEFIKPELSILLKGANNPAKPAADASEKRQAGFMWITSAAQPTSRPRELADK